MIHTSAGRIELLGTTIDAAVKANGSVAVTVVEGKVRLANARGNALVSAGRQAVLLAKLPPAAGMPVNTAEATAWYDGQYDILSADGEIAYIVSRGEIGKNNHLSEVWAMHADGSGKHRVASYIASWSLPGAWLTDQSSLLINPFTFDQIMLDYFAQPWLLNTRSGQDTGLDQLRGYTIQASLFSPDNSQLAFYGQPKVRPDTVQRPIAPTMIYIYNVQRKTLSPLPGFQGAEQQNFAWSPDGCTLAFSEYNRAQNEDELALAAVPGGNITRLHVPGWVPKFSPDGTKLLFTNIGGKGISTLDVSSPGQPPVCISPPLVAPPSHYVHMWNQCWSPDGTRVLWATDDLDEELMLQQNKVERIDRFFVAQADGSARKEVFKLDHGIWDVSWASSGKAFYVRSENDILLVDADGAGVIADLGGNAQDSVLSPDEQAQSAAASDAIRAGISLCALGQYDNSRGDLAAATQAFLNAQAIFAGLPYQYPLAAISVNSAEWYADQMQLLAGQTVQQQ